MHSIHARVQLAALLLLLIFLGIGAVALDNAYRESLETATRDRLMGQIYGLLAAATEDPQGRIQLPETLPDPRFGQPDSGLYAQVVASAIDYQWKSDSLLGLQLSFPVVQQPGKPRYTHLAQGGNLYSALSYAVIWSDAQEQEIVYRLSIAEDRATLLGQINTFRQTLLLWLGGTTILLLLTQGLVLRWGLTPLRRVAADLEQIESGKAERLQGDYPKELQGLALRINSLISSGRASQERYRNSLGDLAHTLKTPLALLQGAVDLGKDEQLHQVVREQVPRLNEIVQYQLKRAAASGFTGVHPPVMLVPLLQRIIRTLDKVYQEKGVTCDLTAAGELGLSADQGDLMELFGNLLENAYKYCNRRVRVSLQRDQGQLHVMIADDGPGIPMDQRTAVLQRGIRIDERIEGQGIGLAMATELIHLYRGELVIGESDIGGTLVDVSFAII